MNLRQAIQVLVGLVLGLPLVQMVLHWAGGLLRAMGDAPAAGVLHRIGAAIGVVWIVSLVGLVVALGLQAATAPATTARASLPDDERDEILP